ncbi:hypothetical protein ACFRJ9_09175 [Paenarthrobacter sp. NPDC056912]|uniref:hypothetical protein n=1 Tax=Paenarthrobacter sp. NPDC056912 TaxID=3345965 RepID=UPI003672FA0C
MSVQESLAVSTEASPTGAVTSVTAVDFVHRNPILASAVAWEWRKQGSSIALGEIHTSWSSFILQDPLEAASWIALDAFSDDLVPLPLKVRIISASGRNCIVLGKLRAAQRYALSAEGAVAILDKEATAAEIPCQITDVVRGVARSLPRRTSIGTAITDREIQILELYARRQALTASTLAKTLGIRDDTVRGHLARGRRKLAAAGLRCSTRVELANALQEIGYSHTDDQWSAVGRW